MVNSDANVNSESVLTSLRSHRSLRSGHAAELLHSCVDAGTRSFPTLRSVGLRCRRWPGHREPALIVPQAHFNIASQPRPADAAHWNSRRFWQYRHLAMLSSNVQTSPGSSPRAAASRRRHVRAASIPRSSAALLKRQGHEVIGVTLQLYDHGEAVGRKGSCCAGQDIHDARRVADRLGIPHYVLDYEQRFKATVMQSFADSYAAGETPIPCVTCNQQIKFHELLSTATRARGRRCWPPATTSAARTALRAPELYRARDAERDQSYFLFATTRGAARARCVSARRLSQGRGARAGARASACRSPTSPTARTSASCRRAATPTSSSA